MAKKEIQIYAIPTFSLFPCLSELGSLSLMLLQPYTSMPLPQWLTSFQPSSLYSVVAEMKTLANTRLFGAKAPRPPAWTSVWVCYRQCLHVLPVGTQWYLSQNYLSCRIIYISQSIKGQLQGPSLLHAWFLLQPWSQKQNLGYLFSGIKIDNTL